MSTFQSVRPLVSGSRKYRKMQASTTHPVCGGEKIRQWQAGAEFRSDQKQDGMSTFLCETLGLGQQEVHCLRKMQASTTHPVCGGEESRQWQAGAAFRSDQKQDGMSTFLCETLGLRH